MAQFGGGQIQGPTTGWCDYCHQKPKFPPYDYCGKACGSRAKATGNTGPSSPTMCKQCGQKPVYKGHQFCGRNCANAWQGMYGQIQTSGNSQPQYGQQSWNAMPPPQMQNSFNNPAPPFQGSNQGGDGGGGIGGIVKGIKGLISQNHQPQPPQQQQQQPGPPNPPHMQQVSGPTSPDPSMISPPITPISSGMGGPTPPGMGDPTPPGSFDPMSPGTPTPTTPGLNQRYYSTPSTPTNPGTQDPNANGQTNGQHLSSPPFPAPRIPNQSSTQGQPMSRTMDLAMNMDPPTNSTGGGPQPNHDPDLDPHTDPSQDPAVTSNHHPNFNQFPSQNRNTGGFVPVQAQAQVSIQVTSSPPMGAGGHGNGGWDPTDPNHFPSQQSTSTSSGSPMMCRLNGCNEPVFMDPVTYHQSDYCSQRHREDATIFGQVNPCIMCLKMPRGPNDHFCSRVCRDKALSP